VARGDVFMHENRGNDIFRRTPVLPFLTVGQGRLKTCDPQTQNERRNGFLGFYDDVDEVTLQPLIHSNRA
jgi:hypothetical protein